jgi:serine/threonine-protein kinase HipA
VRRRELVVLLGGLVAGEIAETDGRMRLRYDEGYRAAGATPLSTSLPVQVPDHPHRPLSAFLWGLLPDNPQVVRRWARDYQVSASSPVSLLSSPVGADCAGAVQFALPEQVDQLLERDGDVEWLAESDVAAKLRGLRADAADWLGGRLRAGQFSLAGAQAKTALRYDPVRGRWGVPHGSEPTSHILKPGITDLGGHALNEHLCLAAARGLGLRAAMSSIEVFEDQVAVVVARYDRIERAGRLQRIHQEDVCQALAVHPDRKYQHDGGPSPEVIVGLLRRILPGSVAADAVDRFVDALIFNWLIGGTDAHAKNYSLLLSGQQVRLAPLYDIASMLPYEHDPLRLHLAMRIGGEYRFKAIRPRDWEKLAATLGLSSGAVLSRARDLSEQLPEALAAACDALPASAAGTDLPERLEASVSAWSTRCRRVLESALEHR